MKKTEMLKELLTNGWVLVRGVWMDAENNDHYVTCQQAYEIMMQTK